VIGGCGMRDFWEAGINNNCIHQGGKELEEELKKR
jgi:hypothetical protein